MQYEKILKEFGYSLIPEPCTFGTIQDSPALWWEHYDGRTIFEETDYDTIDFVLKEVGFDRQTDKFLPRKCGVCGKEFVPEKLQDNFCSVNCFINH